MDLSDRISHFIACLETSRILLVEWEATLLIRLGYPLARNSSLFLLVQDDELLAVRELATSCGLHPADDVTLPPVYICEFADGALRYVANNLRCMGQAPRDRLIFVPISWTGIRRNEIVPMTDDGEPSPPPRTPRFNPPPKVPRNIWTVPLPATCAALARIAVREKRSSFQRMSIIENLSSVLGYNLFDNSYEGDYMDIPTNDVPLSSKEQQEIAKATADIRQWKLRPDEEWLKEELVSMMCGKKPYNDLPFAEDELPLTDHTNKM